MAYPKVSKVSLVFLMSSLIACQVKRSEDIETIVDAESTPTSANADVNPPSCNVGQHTVLKICNTGQGNQLVSQLIPAETLTEKTKLAQDFAPDSETTCPHLIAGLSITKCGTDGSAISTLIESFMGDGSSIKNLLQLDTAGKETKLKILNLEQPALNKEMKVLGLVKSRSRVRGKLQDISSENTSQSEIEVRFNSQDKESIAGKASWQKQIKLALNIKDHEKEGESANAQADVDLPDSLNTSLLDWSFSPEQVEFKESLPILGFFMVNGRNL